MSTLCGGRHGDCPTASGAKEAEPLTHQAVDSGWAGGCRIRNRGQA